MVVAQGQRQERFSHRLSVGIRHEALGRTRDAEDRHFRGINDRRKTRSADMPERRQREAAARHLGHRQTLGARFLGGACDFVGNLADALRSEEHTSELQSLMRISYAVFCLKKKKNTENKIRHYTQYNIYQK